MILYNSSDFIKTREFLSTKFVKRVKMTTSKGHQQLCYIQCALNVSTSVSVMVSESHFTLHMPGVTQF